MLRRLIFAGLVVYAWGLGMFVDSALFLEQNSRLSPLYIATVAPAVVFVLMNLDVFVLSRYSRATVVLACFMVVVALVSVARADFASVLSIGMLCAMLIAFQQSRATIGLGFVNGLFVLSIMSSAVMAASGASKYGIFPGQSEFDPRISLFPYNVTPSWLMALIVIGMNYFYNRTPLLKWLAIATAGYFLAFSGSRSSLIILFVCAAFIAASKIVAFKHRPFYKLFIPIVTLLFIVALNSEGILLFLVSIDSPLVSSFLFRSGGANTAEDATTSIFRTLIWAEHLNLFLSNPFVGQGTFVFADIATAAEIGEGNTGSESFLTGLFARTGLMAVLFVYFIYALAADASRRQDRLSYCLVILLTLSSLAYGSYIVPYDFIFILLFGTMNYARLRSTRALQRHPVAASSAGPGPQGGALAGSPVSTTN